MLDVFGGGPVEVVRRVVDAAGANALSSGSRSASCAAAMKLGESEYWSMDATLCPELRLSAVDEFGCLAVITEV